jgi:hypothetical protein
MRLVLKMRQADLLTAIQARDSNLCPRLAERLPANSNVAVTLEEE